MIKKGFFYCILASATFMLQINAMTKEHYYFPDNLKALEKKGAQQHIPCAFLIDQHNNETPKDKVIQAITSNFLAALETYFIPIIVHQSVIYNFVYRKAHIDDPEHPENKKLENVHFDSRYWYVYNVPHSPFIILIPVIYKDFYKRGLLLRDLSEDTKKTFLDDYPNNINKWLKDNEKYEASIEISPLLDDTNKLQQFLLEKSKNATFSASQFTRLLTDIFQTKKEISAVKGKKLIKGIEEKPSAEILEDIHLPIWDIFINGHGSEDTQIANLSPDQLENLLNFFTMRIVTGTVYIDTCSAGGRNLDLMQFRNLQTSQGKRYRALWNLNYILIVGAVSDMPTWAESEPVEFFYAFFDHAARLKEPIAEEKIKTLKGHALRSFLHTKVSLGNLLAEINTMQKRSGSLHGTANIPQVWLPYGIGFQTFNIDERLKVIGPVLLRIHEEDKKPITINNKIRALLLYPRAINVPLEIQFPQESYVTLKKAQWEYLPSVEELVNELDPAEEEKKESKLSLFEILESDKVAKKFPALLARLEESEPAALHHAFMYPQFISMLRGYSYQQLKEIKLHTPDEYYKFIGVLHFIRDSFFDIGGRESLKTFIIDKLIGINDLSLVLELARVKNNIMDERHPLELALEKYIDKSIILEKVIITTKGNLEWIPEENKNMFSWNITLQFKFVDSAWQFKATNESIKKEQHLWNFKPIGLKEHEETYKEIQQAVQETLHLQRGDLAQQKKVSEILEEQLKKIEKKKGK